MGINIGIDMITALEIFTNPKDLEIVIGREKEGAKFSIGIFRGPGHNFKPILTSRPFAEKLEDAIEVIKTTLELAHDTMMKNSADQNSLLTQILNPDGLEIDQSMVMNHELIAWILNELRQHRIASTYKMIVATS